MKKPSRRIEVLHSISRVDPTEWNALAKGDFVFADHRFFSALEESGSVGERTGWHPLFLTVRDGDHLVGALPLYAKANSYGEYIFDWAWANAYRAHGVAYYPKLVAAIPFTPATGPKFLIAPEADAVEITGLLTEMALGLMKENEAFSSLHLLFLTEAESQRLQHLSRNMETGLMVRHSHQYHWRNHGWKTFDDFLAALRRKRRAEIRREREAVARLPVTIETLTGSDLTPAHATAMYGFYLSTIQKMGGIPYLTKSLFEQVFRTMPDEILLVLAREQVDGQAVAGALNFKTGQTVYGRYWGCHEEYKNLHFELCYYRAIDWALENGVTLFEAGAQGEHKFSRGFMPSLCYSAHAVAAPEFSIAISRFIEQEKEEIREMFDEMREHDPFKNAELQNDSTSGQGKAKIL